MLTALALMALGCGHRLENQQRKMMTEIYESNAEMYDLLESAFEDLGREYYVMFQEYQDAGNESMAQRIRQRATLFHGYALKLHQYKVLNDNKLARVKNGGDPVVTTRSAEKPPRVKEANPVLDVQPIEIPQSYPQAMAPEEKNAPVMPEVPSVPAPSQGP
jgi:hypothetical protein